MQTDDEMDDVRSGMMVVIYAMGICAISLLACVGTFLFFILRG